MFEYATPEQVGIQSQKVERMISFLERNGLVLHSLLMMRGEKLFAEYYWAPFHRDFCHRMYSQTKSYVGIAIGLLEEEGKLSLDDPILKYFPDKSERQQSRYLKKQTIRDMLTMCTSLHSPYWFDTEDPDRVHEYFNASNVHRPAGTIWEYDSPGSQVLAVLVERLSGRSLFDYLNEKIFRHLGTFQTSTILKTPTGDSWGDSALLCTSRDMMSFGRLLLSDGVWNGKRLIPKDYLRKAVSTVADNHRDAFQTYNSHGYGYQIWKNSMGGFSFHGMGGQFTVCVPAGDLVVVCTGDNQGHPAAGHLFFAAVEEFIVQDLCDHQLPENPKSQASLAKRTADLRLQICPGQATTEYAKTLHGKTYLFENAPFGWKKCTFTFGKNDEGTLIYENDQGEKTLPFGLGKNVFCKFPQYGYSDGVGGVSTGTGFLYDCASSAGWTEATKLVMRVQIIDRYFGNLFMIFAFKGNEVAVFMNHVAENFLNEYTGRAVGKLQTETS